jgi:hypothetical protein
MSRYKIDLQSYPRKQILLRCLLLPVAGHESDYPVILSMIRVWRSKKEAEAQLTAMAKDVDCTITLRCIPYVGITVCAASGDVTFHAADRPLKR